MHDIGKVRTQKTPTADSFGPGVVTCGATRDGPRSSAEPGKPILAPVVAFENHLRLDARLPVRGEAHASTWGRVGQLSGIYMRCGRSVRTAGFPTDRILAVLKRTTDQFDQHWYAFVQLLGVTRGHPVRLTRRGAVG